MVRFYSRLLPLQWILLWMLTMGIAMVAQSSYTVKPRDTVYGVARAHQMSVEDLYKLNPELRSRSLRSGEVIKLKSTPRIQTGTTHVSPQSKNTIHRVQKGETLSSISRAYGVSVKELIKLNPEISPDNLPEGFRLVIPTLISPSVIQKAKETAQTMGQDVVDVSKKVVDKAPMAFGDVFGQNGRIDTVRVSLVLPLGAQAPERYVRFYEGFLMGLNDLKKNGVSVILHTYNADNKTDVQKIIQSGSLIGEHLIIGGASEEGIDLLATHSRKRGVPYVVPFNSQMDASLLASTVFQVNAPQDYLHTHIATEFVRLYRGRKIYFVGDGSHPTEAVVAPIVDKLKQTEAAYTYIKMDEVTQVESSAVIVPLSSTKQELTAIIDRLNTTVTTPTLFGYPVWQTFDKATIGRMSKYGCTIYSTFFFNGSDSETNTFATKYNAWYGHPVAAGYPKYSVLGYDIARYFVRALASYGMDFHTSLPMIPTDGLQTDFTLRQPSGHGGYINANIFFITYQPTGVPQKRNIFR